MALVASSSGGEGVRSAVEEYVTRIADVSVVDLSVRQTVTIYHPDGRHPLSLGEQRLFVKLPGRQRLEQTLEGRREVRLVVDDRGWIRGPDGRVREAAPTERDRSHALAPLKRSAPDLLAAWKRLGIREDVSERARFHGRPVTVIGASAQDRTAPAVWLDPEYGVVRVITRETLPRGPVLADLTLSEHRRVAGGYFYPYRQELFADGRLLVLVVVQSVEVNRGLSDALFDPEALRAER
jgi:hypothetical protein